MTAALRIKGLGLIEAHAALESAQVALFAHIVARIILNRFVEAHLT
jgi:hypothetical protein